ncbi:MAG: hypothetical protein KAK00_10725 [Nanoarchaeota archaeon]|nr:hypothetical protein [Nanoarchaeota archaeon]
MKKTIIFSILILALFLSACISQTKVITQSGVDTTPKITTSETQKASIPDTGSEPYKKIVTLTGEENQDTETFTINTDKVKIVAGTENSAVGSFTSIILQKKDGDDTLNMNLILKSLQVTADAGEEGKGELIIEDLTKGSYYISVTSGIKWEITVYEYS